MTTITSTSMPYLDDLRTGDQLTPITYDVSQERIDNYGLASLDLNPVHMDPTWAARARVFGMPETVQHGMMSMSYMTSVVLRSFGALAEITSVRSTFTNPAPCGSTITCQGVVRDVHVPGNGDDHAVITVTSTDQDGDTVGVSEIAVRLPRRPA
jgi:phosphate acetyltransferase